jgi:ribose-phosphate pyrophosphokinase
VRALDIDNPVVVSPDVGGIKMARSWAKALGADLAIVDKRRISGSEIACRARDRRRQKAAT